MRGKSGRVLGLLGAGLAAIAVVVLLGCLARTYALDQAERRVRDAMLECRAFHRYVQGGMHPAYKKLIEDGRLPQGFFAPELLSSSYIARSIHRHYNTERREAGLPEVRYRMATVNPRNPVNKATPAEQELIAWFNEDRARKSYREVIKEDGREYLLYAQPFLTVEQRCLKCHGKPEDAPAELREAYNWTGGWNLKVGDIVAVESIRSPLEGEYNIAMVVVAGLVVITAAVVILLIFNNRLRTLVSRRSKDLQESETRYRLLADNSADLIWTCAGREDNFRMTYINPAIKEMLGYSVEEFLQLPIEERMSPESLDIVDEAISEMTRSRRPAVFQIQHIHKNGELVDCELWARPILGPDDQITGFQGRTIDITERKRAERARQEAETRYRELFNNMANGVAVYEPTADGRDFIIKDMNRNGAKASRCDRGDVVGRSVLEAFPGIEEMGLFDVLQRVWLTGEPERVRASLYRDQHTRAWYDNQVYKLPSGDVVAVYDDVTERKHAEEALRESEERMELALQGADLGTWDWDVRTGKVTFNERWAAMLGYTLDEIEPHVRTWEGMVHADDLPRVRDELNAHLEGRTDSYEAEHRVRHKSGDWVWVLDKGRVTHRDDNGKPLRACGTHLDVTDRKRAEQSLVEQNKTRNALIEALPYPTMLIRKDRTVLFANRKARDFGATVGGLCWRDFGRSYYISEADKAYIDEHGNPPPSGTHCTFCLADEALGTSKTATAPDVAFLGGISEISWVPIDEDTYLHFAMDITERKRAEETLRLGEARLSLALDVSGAGIWRWNIKTGELNLDDRFHEMLGYLPNELPANVEDWKRWHHPDEIDSVMAKRERHLRGETPVYEGNHRLLRKNGDWAWVFTRGKVVSWDADHNPETFLGVAMDITERKRAEEALEKRVLALTQPLEDTGTIAFDDLFNLDDIQRLQDRFAEATGVASIITQTDGTPLTKPSNFTRLCNDIIRGTKEGCANCYKSDAQLGCFRLDGPTIEPCQSGGLWDAGAAITVGGKHVANWLIGQVRNETQTEERMREYARKIEADEETFIEAYREVPVMPYEQFERVAQALFTIARQLSASAFQNVQQARFITECKRAENELASTTAFLDTVVDMSPFAMWVSDETGMIIRTNRALCEILNLASEEIVGKYNVLEDQNLNDAGLMSLTKGVFEVHQPIRFNMPWKATQAGDVSFEGARDLYIDVSMFPILNDAGELTNVVCQWVDITERKRAEESLLSEKLLSEDYINSLPGLFYVFDETRFVRWNTQWETVTGYTAEELSVMYCTDFFEGEDRRIIQEKMLEVFREGGAEVEAELTTKDGRRIPYLFTGLRREFNGKPHLVGFGLDITERKRMEEERAALEDQLRQAQKLEAVGQLAGGVAHDFNNILTAIFGNTQLAVSQLKSAFPEATKAVERIEQVRESAKRAASLTRQLLTFSRRQVIQPEVLDLNRILADLDKMLRRLITENVTLETIADPNLQSVRADAGQLEQVVVNLVVNAVHAMPDGGRLTLETKNVILEEEYIESHAEARSGPHVLLVVSDTGHGMDAATCARIFEPFYTTKAVDKGTGLGLATVHGIVKQAGGHIVVYSEPGRGTTFRVYLPAIDATPVEPAPVLESEKPSTGAETVLLCEDDRFVRELAAQLLRNAGYTVIAVGSGNEGLEAARNHTGSIDLLITDVIMPGMNGRELSEQLGAALPGLPTLFISGYTSNVIAHHGVLDEGVEFLEKPFTQQGLLTKVRTVLDAKKPDASLKV